jgi:hypothetical protein
MEWDGRLARQRRNRKHGRDAQPTLLPNRLGLHEFTFGGVYAQRAGQGKHRAAVLALGPARTLRTAGLAARAYFRLLLRVQPLGPNQPKVRQSGATCLRNSAIELREVFRVGGAR